MALSAGTVLGPYEILSPLGSGGMADVYRARDTRLGREVAIKVLSQTRVRDREALPRFEQEARSASALNHPNIITIYEIGSHPVGEEAIWYIAMELVEGQSLRQILSSGPVPTQKLLDIAVQISGALAAAHAKGIVHRDLKPENILVNREDRVKVLDFGLATPAVSESSENQRTLTCAPDLMTLPGTILGTVGYMSPQQAAGERVDFRSDQFSFGVILYEMATGRRAFERRSAVETLAAILRDDPESIGHLNPHIPPPIQWTVKRCLAKKPADRYATTEDLARDLTIMRDHIGEEVVEAPCAPCPRQLPPQRNTLVGRERELQVVKNLLMRDDIRLITLTGPGGTGKTRLALQLAEDVAGQFTGGVWYAGLASVLDSGLVVSAIAQALEVRPSRNRPLVEDMKEHMRRSPRALLLLDNFEHVLAAAPVVTELLGASRELKILVTSRAALHIYGEQEFHVPPLPLPDPSNVGPVELLSDYPAVALFVQRARAVKPGFALGEDNAAPVVEICARLDGLPLAIELAAARVKVLTPAAILGRLKSRLRLLTGGARDLPERQQTLRRAMDWSYELLTGEEQKLFRRLAVFAGGFTVEAAEAVANAGVDLDLDAFDGVASLVDKSLLQQTGESAGEARFGMLETVREYGIERLDASAEEGATRRAHAAYFLILAEDGAPHMAAGAEQALWLERFFSELDNIRAALGWLTRTGDADWGLRLALALSQFWMEHAHPTEGREWITALLKLPGGSALMRMRALSFAIILCNRQGDFASALQLNQESLAFGRQQGDRPYIAVSLNGLGVTQSLLGKHSAAKESCALAFRAWEDLDEPGAAARVLSNLADISKAEGDYARALSLHEQAFSRFHALDDRAGMAWSLNHQGDVLRAQGEILAARRIYEQGLEIFRDQNDGPGVASSLLDLGRLASEEGAHVSAHALFSESLRISRALGRKWDVAGVLEELARLAARQGRWERALRLAGAATALRQRIGAPLAPTEKVKLDADLDPARQGLPGAAATTAWMRGWATSPDEAIEYGLDGS
jgi:predicted ATPase/tetratricopeptide (TPR) repeat protein/tRNA A-37 threonylcarbamoyl transferase component Bud32